MIKAAQKSSLVELEITATLKENTRISTQRLKVGGAPNIPKQLMTQININPPLIETRLLFSKRLRVEEFL